jgi:hypothetical protein
MRGQGEGVEEVDTSCHNSDTLPPSGDTFPAHRQISDNVIVLSSGSPSGLDICVPMRHGIW